MTFFWYSVLILIVQNSYILCNKETTELIGVFIIGRHADRTPEETQMESFPNNVYINETFQPFGFGALTNLGKQRAYKQGQYFRHAYGKFLSEYYLPSEIIVKSTRSERSIATALTTLASLYEPIDVQIWDDFLAWQPVPVWTADLQDPELMAMSNCQKYITEMSAASSGNISKPSEFLELLSKYVGGSPITDRVTYINIYDVLSGLENFGLPLPEWAITNRNKLDHENNEVWNDFINNYPVKLNSGVLLNRILLDSSELMKGNQSIPKFQLFLSHDIHVSSMLKLCTLPHPGRPGYASSIALELRRDTANGSYGFKFVYVPKTGAEPIIVMPAGCNKKSLCKFEEFKNLVSKNLLDVPSYRKQCAAAAESKQPKHPNLTALKIYRQHD